MHNMWKWIFAVLADAALYGVLSGFRLIVK